MSGSVFDEVRDSTPTDKPTESNASVFDDVRASTAPAEAPPPPQPSLWGSIKGTGEAAMSIASGTGHAIGHAVNDLLPEGSFLGSTRAQEEQRLNADPLFNYEPKTPEGQAIMGGLGKLFHPIQVVGKAAHDYIANSFGKRAADVTGDVATLAPFAVREGLTVKAVAAEKAAEIETGHPLSGAAGAERQRLADVSERAKASGFDLPESGSPERHAVAAETNTPLVNAAVRQSMNLPKNAPLTPKMFAVARKEFGAPGYDAIEKIPDPIKLDRSALDDAMSSNMNAKPSERLPFPEGDTISGKEAVEFSKKARYLANNLEKNPTNPFASQDAQMYRDAAEAVEDSVEKHLNESGQGALAKAWDDARVYYAKTYSAEGALDGAGNVRASDLKNQLFRKGKPLSGQLEDIATLAAQYPEAFKTTRVTIPRPGVMRRTVAGVAPVVGAGIGGSFAGGTGAVAGEMAGSYLGDRVLRK